MKNGKGIVRKCIEEMKQTKEVSRILQIWARK